MKTLLGNRRCKIVVGLAIVAGLGLIYFWRSGGKLQRAVEETRQALRKEGFKTDLADFNLSTPPELRGFETALLAFHSGVLTPRVPLPELMTPVGADTALVVWKQDWLSADYGEIRWPTLAGALATNRAKLDAVCAAALAGPFRFNLEASHGSAMLLRPLAPLKAAAETLGGRLVLQLHDHDQDAAWTNLLAVTRLVTAWEVEPVEISHLVRFNLAAIAYNATWQALQADGWSDDRLARLQQEWASVDFFRNLPATAAFARACTVATCGQERRQPAGPGLPLTRLLKEMFRSPRSAGATLSAYWRQVHYRTQGSFEDEKALLLFYRARELELRRALESPTWLQMRQLPGVTNVAFFKSKYSSRMQSMLNVKAMAIGFQRLGSTLAGGAAEAEARRRLILTALALERHRGRHGAYPKSLPELAPGLLQQPPVDFRDGRPLRYRLTDDAHFVLYSVGLDGVDNGGQMQPRPRPGAPYGMAGPRGPVHDPHLVWPRPATAAEAERLHQEEKKVKAEQTDRQEETCAAAWWGHTARRQANVEKILAGGPGPMTKERAYRGRPLGEVLGNPIAAGTNKLTLAELLTLKQLSTGAEPEIATFELPLRYDVLTNIGSLNLYVDPIADEDSDQGCNAGQLECNRATNGNCLLVWNTIYETPGQHALQAGLLVLNEGARPDEDIGGPLTAFVVSNLCQFSLSSAQFDPESGVTLRAKLPELNGAYAIEFHLPSGQRVKTLTGSTTNGVIKAHWDLIDDRGRQCQSESFDTVLHLTLPDSGRSQTLKGP